MSASDSDESISTEDQLELVENKKASVERIKPKPKRKMSEKQLENLRKGREARAKGKYVKLDGKETEPEPTPEPVPEPKQPAPKRTRKPKPPKREKSPEPPEPPEPEEEYVPPPGSSAPIDIPVKRPRGRPRKDAQQKNVAVKEKVVYLAPIGENGEYEPVTIKSTKITAKNVRRHENMVKSQEISEEHDTNYKLKKNGKIDGRSMNRGASKKRTEKQIAAAKALGERTKAKFAKIREEKEKKLKESIEDTIIDVVSQPMKKVKEKKEAERKSVEQVQKEKLAKNLSLFS